MSLLGTPDTVPVGLEALPFVVSVWRLEERGPGEALVLEALNRRARQVVGDAGAGAQLGQTMLDLFPALAGTAVPAACARAARTGEPQDLEAFALAGPGAAAGPFRGFAFALPRVRAGLLLQEVTEAEERLRALALRLEEVREAERTELAHEIHDVLGQELTMLKLDAAHLLGPRRRGTRRGAPGDPRPADVVERVDRLIGIVRRLASDLRPPVLDYAGLADAIEEETARFGARTDLATRFESTLDRPTRDRRLATAVFRILQEALTNVVRHAAARAVSVRVRVEGDVLGLEVADDGRGFDPSVCDARRSLGLLGMRERAAALGGTLGIEAGPGRGTVVRLRVPLGPADRRGQQP